MMGEIIVFDSHKLLVFTMHGTRHVSVHAKNNSAVKGYVLGRFQYALLASSIKLFYHLTYYLELVLW